MRRAFNSRYQQVRLLLFTARVESPPSLLLVQASDFDKLQFVCLIGGLIAVYRTKFQYVFRTFDLSFMFHFFVIK